MQQFIFTERNFKDLLNKSLEETSHVITSLDESYNRVMKTGQMNVLEQQLKTGL